MKITCKFKNCESVFESDLLTERSVYVCKNHNKTQQRTFFQNHAFDKSLGNNVSGTVAGAGGVRVKSPGSHHTKVTDEVYQQH